jgi:hypothetical protein
MKLADAESLHHCTTRGGAAIPYSPLLYPLSASPTVALEVPE